MPRPDPDEDYLACMEGGCLAAGLATTHKCWSHADEPDVDAALKKLGEDGQLDARGALITAELLRRLLAAAPKDEHGRTTLTYAWFSQAYFESITDFREVIFQGPASFEGATFQWISSFHGATFRDDAWFQGATFQSLVAFASPLGKAIFEGVAWFQGATFRDNAWFQGITFQRDADFSGAHFWRATVFDEVTFQSTARFARATFHSTARFARTTFQQAQQLGPTLVRKGFVLDDAVFHERTQIEVAAAALCCNRVRFLAGVQLRVRWAQVVLDDADLAAPSILTGAPPFPNLDEGRWAKAMERLLPQRRGRPGRWRWQPRLVSLCRADVAGLTVGLVDMRACRFADAHHLDQLRLETLGAFGDTPSGWRWTARQALAEEHCWRQLRATRRQPAERSAVAMRRRQHDRHGHGWFPPACQPPSWAEGTPLAPVQIAAVYRAMRKGREDNKDEPGAADFYYGEMEMRRFAKREDAMAARRQRHVGAWAAAATEHAVLWLYWLVSGYGLRAWRALAALAVVIGLVGVGFSRVGFHHPHPSQMVSWLYALQATVSLEGKAPQLSGGQLTLPGELLRIGLRFTGPVLLGLALLSLRGRVKR